MEGCSVPMTSSSELTQVFLELLAGSHPMILIGIATSPASRQLDHALCQIADLTGTPMSSMNTSPPVESTDAWSTSCTASSTLMKNLVMRGR